MESAGGVLGAYQRLDLVRRCGGDIDRVFEPFAGLEVVDHIAAGIGADDVDVFGEAIEAAGIARNRVVICDAFAAFVEILRLELTRHGKRCAEIWRLRGRRRRDVRHSDVDGCRGAGVAGGVARACCQCVTAIRDLRRSPGNRVRAAVSSVPSAEPSTKNCTPTTPTLSDALAVTDMELETVPPFAVP